MSHFISQMKEQLLANCFPLAKVKDYSTAFKPVAGFESSINCFLRVMKSGNSAGLLARINYYFDTDVPVSLNNIVRYTEVLNSMLKHSQVFVVQDLDG